jgi:hypothetical protein
MGRIKFEEPLSVCNWNRMEWTEQATNREFKISGDESKFILQTERPACETDIFEQHVEVCVGDERPVAVIPVRCSLWRSVGDGCAKGGLWGSCLARLSLPERNELLVRYPAKQLELVYFPQLDLLGAWLVPAPRLAASGQPRHPRCAEEHEQWRWHRRCRL